jgi:hypothetical protein
MKTAMYELYEKLFNLKNKNMNKILNNMLIGLVTCFVVAVVTIVAFLMTE